MILPSRAKFGRVSGRMQSKDPQFETPVYEMNFGDTTLNSTHLLASR
jgi:hypothetical protein